MTDIHFVKLRNRKAIFDMSSIYESDEWREDEYWDMINRGSDMEEDDYYTETDEDD